MAPQARWRRTSSGRTLSSRLYTDRWHALVRNAAAGASAPGRAQHGQSHVTASVTSPAAIPASARPKCSRASCCFARGTDARAKRRRRPWFPTGSQIVRSDAVQLDRCGSKSTRLSQPHKLVATHDRWAWVRSPPGPWLCRANRCGSTCIGFLNRGSLGVRESTRSPAVSR